MPIILKNEVKVIEELSNTNSLALTWVPSVVPEWSFFLARYRPSVSAEGGAGPLSLFYLLQNKSMADSSNQGKEANNLQSISPKTHTCWQDGTPSFIFPQPGCAPGVKSPLASLQLDPTEAELSLRRRSFRDQPLGPFNTCRLPAQGHPDYLTACPVCKAVYFLIVKPIASCFLQLSGRNEKNESDV